MGTAALLGTGIDVKTEQGRAELYKKQLDLTKKKELAGQREALAAAEAGDGTFTDEGGTWTVDQLKKRIAELEQEIGNDAAMPVDVLGDMQRDARDQLAASADGFRSSLDGIDARAQKRNREPGRGAVGDAAAGAAKQAQDELARLTAAATAAREAARAKAAEDREKVEEAQESNDPATMRGEVFGSYSAAALQARSGGGSLAERAAKAGERAADGIDDLARRFEALNGVEKEILDEIRLGGALA
jgi:t-SNARE complex subunit (syntaxin)